MQSIKHTTFYQNDKIPQQSEFLFEKSQKKIQLLRVHFIYFLKYIK